MSLAENLNKALKYLHEAWKTYDIKIERCCYSDVLAALDDVIDNDVGVDVQTFDEVVVVRFWWDGNDWALLYSKYYDLCYVIMPRK